MTIEGDYAQFAHLETVYLGCMARRSLVMRNVREVVDAARGKPILFFPARHDHWLVQTGDGWAAHVAGAIGVSTDAQASWWGGRGVGTVPHALIAAFGGDTVAAARAFADRYRDAHQRHRARRLRERLGAHRASRSPTRSATTLWGVRLDTSETLVDEALADLGDAAPRGVNVELARRVRAALDDAGHQRVKIVASGGFDAEKIRALRGRGRTRRRLRRRLLAAARPERLHRRHRRRRRRPGREGRPRAAAEPAPRARAVDARHAHEAEHGPTAPPPRSSAASRRRPTTCPRRPARRRPASAWPSGSPCRRPPTEDSSLTTCGVSRNSDGLAPSSRPAAVLNGSESPRVLDGSEGVGQRVLAVGDHELVVLGGDLDAGGQPARRRSRSRRRPTSRRRSARPS